MPTDTTAGRSRWRRILGALALLVGGFVAFLAAGMGVTDGEGIDPGAVLILAVFLLVGGSLIVWGIQRVRE